jgi:ABC-type branched-subunit amino acid transport system ATPase component
VQNSDLDRVGCMSAERANVMTEPTTAQSDQQGHRGLSDAAQKRIDRFVFDEIFGLFPVRSGMLGRRGGDFSGGQQQQLAMLARWSRDQNYCC